VRRLGLWRRWVMALLGIAGFCATPARAAELSEFAPSYSGSQVMLYMSWSLATQGPRAQTFGLRYERSTPVSSDPGARFCAPLAHRSLVDFQFARDDRPRVQFGPRVTWDISRGRIEPTKLFDAWTLTAPAGRSAAMGGWVP